MKTRSVIGNWKAACVLAGSVLVIGLLGVGPLSGAIDMFLKIEGIDGESADKMHKGEIDVLAWSFGMSNSGSTYLGGVGGSGKANFQDLSFTKWIDKSSPKLMFGCASGQRIPKATLVVRKAGDTQFEYLTYELTDLIVTSVSTGGSGGEDRLTENVTLNFAQIKVTYNEQRPDGSSAGAVDFNWNIAENSPRGSGLD